MSFSRNPIADSDEDLQDFPDDATIRIVVSHPEQVVRIEPGILTFRRRYATGGDSPFWNGGIAVPLERIKNVMWAGMFIDMVTEDDVFEIDFSTSVVEDGLDIDPDIPDIRLVG